jgi:hypothetical protein
MSPLRGGFDEQKFPKMKLTTREHCGKRMVKAVSSESIWTSKNMKEGL